MRATLLAQMANIQPNSTAKANGNTLRPDADSSFGEVHHALPPPKQQCDLDRPRERANHRILLLQYNL